MRKAECHWNDSEAAVLLATAETVHLASSTEEGIPVLRALHAVCVGDLIAFHGAKAGERKLCLGRVAVVSAERILANIPSYFVDPERACPATTYYESAQARGMLVEVTDLDEKAAVIEALMQKYQPEGKYEPLSASNPLYEKALKGLLVFGVRVEEMTGKYQAGQRRKGDELTRILEGLRKRGNVGDLEAIDHIMTSRKDASFAMLQGPKEANLRCRFGIPQLQQVVDLLRGTYWNQGTSDQAIANAHKASTAWVGAVAADGSVLGTARALADGSKVAWIYDVIVGTQCRSQGVGSAVMKLLLDHPMIRGCQSIGLVTRDAQSFYEQFGFHVIGPHAPTGFSHLLLRRQSIVRFRGAVLRPKTPTQGQS
jgi:nitroimidazol reductase NimA-like FMN-containing flavoprotein (pyridoxamine 5'-phosphate oxidase superfamily)/ribosomal protein S18 acetylase RimI-like enzyme